MEGELQLNLRQIVHVLEDILGRPSRLLLAAEQEARNGVERDQA